MDPGGRMKSKGHDHILFFLFEETPTLGKCTLWIQVSE